VGFVEEGKMVMLYNLTLTLSYKERENDPETVRVGYVLF
jgi:hypothetical protein